MHRERSDICSSELRAKRDEQLPAEYIVGVQGVRGAACDYSGLRHQEWRIPIQYVVGTGTDGQDLGRVPRDFHVEIALRTNGRVVRVVRVVRIRKQRITGIGVLADGADVAPGE